MAAKWDHAKCPSTDAVAPESPKHCEPTDSHIDSASRLLYTPAAAAERLTVGKPWLRRKAGQRLIPCTFVANTCASPTRTSARSSPPADAGPSNRNQTSNRPAGDAGRVANTRSGLATRLFAERASPLPLMERSWTRTTTRDPSPQRRSSDEMLRPAALAVRLADYSRPGFRCRDVLPTMQQESSRGPGAGFRWWDSRGPRQSIEVYHPQGGGGTPHGLIRRVGEWCCVVGLRGAGLRGR
jgi:hypothetical protein